MNAPARKETPALKSAAPIAERTMPEPIQTQPYPIKATPAAPAPYITKRALPDGRMQPVGYKHNAWDATAEQGTIVLDVLQPNYWRHVAAQFKQFDSITIICEDGTWEAELRVLACDRLWAKVHPKGQWDYTASYSDMPRTQEEEFDVNWNITGNYRITRKGQPGMQPIKDGFQTKLAAYEWLDGYIKTLNK